MSEESVNVESRTSSQDKRWTIMAALLGTNTAFMLFHGIEQERDPKFIRELALAIIAATIPFQGIYFLIYTFLLEHKGELSEERMTKLRMASAICQIVSYMSLLGLANDVVQYFTLCRCRLLTFNGSRHHPHPFSHESSSH